MPDFLKDWGALGVAFVALVQPWLWAAYRRWGRSGRLEIYESGVIELGFSRAGPLLVLHGTLRATLEDVFVRRMRVEVIRLAAGASQPFGWAAFRPTDTGAGGAQALALPHSFNVLSSDTFVYSVVFNAAQLGREVEEALLPAAVEWFQEPVNQERRNQLVSGGTVDQALVQRAADAWSSFSQRPSFLTAFSDIQRRCFWEAGRYRLTLQADCTGRKPPVQKSWQFEVTEDQASALRLNAILVLNQACGQQADLPLNFVRVDYQSDAGS